MSQSIRARPAWLAARNDRTAFRLLLEHGPLTRSKLGELSGLSKPTATPVLPRLERVGLIRAGRRGLGRPRPERGELRRANRPHHGGGRSPSSPARSTRSSSTRSTASARSRRSRGCRGARARGRREGPRSTRPAGPPASTIDRQSRRDRRAGRRLCRRRRALVHRHPARLARAGRPPAHRGGARPHGDPRQRREPRGHRGAGPGCRAGRIELRALLDRRRPRRRGRPRRGRPSRRIWRRRRDRLPRGAEGGRESSHPEANDFTDLLGGAGGRALLGGTLGESLTDVLPRLAGDDRPGRARRPGRPRGRPIARDPRPRDHRARRPDGLAGGDRLADLVAARVDPAASELGVRTAAPAHSPCSSGLGSSSSIDPRQLEADISLAP